MVSAELIKTLRERTGAGLLDCKKALESNENDIEKSIDWLREKGIAKSAGKADRIAAEGLTAIAVKDNFAVLCEINSETDFVARNELFIKLVNEIAHILIEEKPTTIETALNTNVKGYNNSLQIYINENAARIGEKVSLRRFTLLEKEDKQTFGCYSHMGGKIGAICIIEGNNSELARDISMHIAAINPTYVDKSDINNQFIEKERKIQIELSKQDPKLISKEEKDLMMIIDRKVEKIISEICLNDQKFVKNPDITISKHCQANNTKIIDFTRYGVGDGIEKKEDNFVEEVMKQVRK